MRFLVMGAGSIGCVVGGFLAKAGHDVTLVGRPGHMEAIAKHGLRITGIWGEHQVTNLRTRTHPADLSDPADSLTFDIILITVKSYDTAAAADAIVPLCGPETLVCAYQNGLGNAEHIAERVGWERTVGVRAIYGTRITAPGEVTVTVIAQPTALGVYHGSAPAQRVRELAALMDAAGLPTVYTEKIATVLWAKVIYNAAMNAQSALLGVPYGGLLETEDTRAIMRDVVHEAYATAEAIGTPLEPDTPEAYVRWLFDELIPPTAQHFASMHEDLAQRKRTEIDALNGAIVRYAEQQRVPVPVNQLLTRLIRAREHALGIT